MVAVAYFFVAAYIFMRDFTRRKINTKIRVEKATQLQVGYKVYSNNSVVTRWGQE